MRTIVEMARQMWPAFGAAGAAAVVAAVVAVVWTGSPAPLIGVWAIVAGMILLAGAYRTPGGLTGALAFLGAAVAGLVLGVALVVLPSRDPRTAVIAVGIWGILAAAGYLSVSRIVRALGLPDAGLFATAWVGLAAGMAIVAMPVLGFAATTGTAAAALGVTGIVTIFAAMRLRMLRAEAPAPVSRRELDRRARAGRRR